MTKRMLIDATHPEETRVVVLDGNRLEEFDLETAHRRPLKGNIYLAKVVRVEPSLQAAFVEYGGNRHGFLAFSEIHPDYYQIPIADRQRLLEMQAEEAREEDEEAEAEAATQEVEREARAIATASRPLAEEPSPPNAEAASVGEAEPSEAAPAAADAPPPADAEGAEASSPPEPPAAAETPEAGDLPEAAAPAAGPVTTEEAEAQPPSEEPPEARPEAKPLAMATERVSGDPESLPTESGESSTAAEIVAVEAEAAEAPVPHEGVPVPEGGVPIPAAIESEAEAALRESPVPEAEVEIVPHEAPPPETIGGEDGTSDVDEDRRERRIPPKFLRHYKIQEVIKRRQIMLVQVVKEERGNKGAALTTYISLAGRFSVLMPNSPRGGGVSRKITSAADRKRLRDIIDELHLPEGMSLIIRTAGAQRPKPEIKRDCEYLLRLWDSIRERTLSSTAPALIYEEADLIKRSIRDVYARDVEEITVDGEEAFQEAREFMRMLMPSHVSKVKLYRNGGMPLFARYGVDQQLDAMHSPVVQLRSGGYLVINQTEALVAIDVNSGRATRDRHIEDTALRTNLEAADEIARQLRLRDLAGLIVIDFIDMESSKHDAMVEKRLKEALKQDRARIQVGRISHFGLLEMSRQRLHPSIAERHFITCPSCQGRGLVRSVESSALQVIRQIEEEGAKRRAAEVAVHVSTPVALWLLNHKRDRLAQIEDRFGMAVLFQPDDALAGAACRIERTRAQSPEAVQERPAALRMDYAPEAEEETETAEAEAEETEAAEAAEGESAERSEAAAQAEAESRRRRRRRRRRGGRREEGAPQAAEAAEGEAEDDEEEQQATDEEEVPAEADAEPAAGESERDERPEAQAEGSAEEEARRRRRRGRRGGRRRREDEEPRGEEAAPPRPVQAPTPRYAGPTPADPFAGQFDHIFEAMEAAEFEAEAQASGRGPRPEPAPIPPAPPVEARAAEAPQQEQAAVPEAPDAAPVISAPEPEPTRAAAPVEVAPAADIAAPAAAPSPVAHEPEPASLAEKAPEAEAPAAAPEASQEPKVGAPVLPKVLGEDVPETLPRRRGWWRR